MAISLGFGVLFATGIILLVVPSLYMIVEDILGVFGHSKDSERNLSGDLTVNISTTVESELEQPASK